MRLILLDTHIWAWLLLTPAKLSAAARQEIETADEVFVSPISIYEIAQKVRIGKWAEMEPVMSGLAQMLASGEYSCADVTPQMCQVAGTLDWPHRDPFDRMIAATARVMDVTLISADTVFDGLGLRRVW